MNPVPWKVVIFLLGIALICFLIGTGLVGCKSPDLPPIDVSFWAGDSAKAGVTRKQEGETLLATDPLFDQMACLTYVDIQKIYSTLLKCKDWGSLEPMTSSDFQYLKNKNRELIQKVSHLRKD